MKIMSRPEKALITEKQTPPANKKVDGYCICCGAPSYIGEDNEVHDESCIWFEETDIGE